MQKLTMQDAETKSLDIVAQNIEQLKAIFPDAFADGRIDFGVLRQLLGDKAEEGEEKYGLNWHGKRRARQLALTPSAGTLLPCPEDSMGWDTTQNLMIEGDNLEVLKLLQKSYASKVDLIYIDPPYNTGNEFIYQDDFRDNIQNYHRLTGQRSDEGTPLVSNPESSGRLHTDWLNMMYPRLRLARGLLNPTGAIFVSIDSHESSHLRDIMDEVFGEENFVGELAVSLNPKGRQLAPFFATSHESIVCYARDADLTSLETSSSENVDEDDFPFTDPNGSHYRLLPLRNTNKKFTPRNRPNLYYSLWANVETGVVRTSQFTGAVEVKPVFGDGSDAVWRWGKPKAALESDQLMARVVNGREGGRVDVFQKDYYSVDRKKKIPSIWISDEVGSTDTAVSELKELMGPVFQNPKPLKLLRRIIATMPADSLILDFFGGSGTLAQAVMMQNSMDQGTRQFVLVQLPEPITDDTAEGVSAMRLCAELGKPPTVAELTKERLRRAGKKIHGENPMFGGDVGFRVFKLDSSNIRTWEPDLDDLAHTLLNSVDHLKDGRSEQDILFELLLKLGLDLTVPIEQQTIAGKAVYSIGAGTLLACLAEHISSAEVEPLAEGIVAWHKQQAPVGDSTVVFRDSAFADDVAKTNLTAILQQRGLANIRSL